MTVDGLTGAYNKRYLMEALAREVARSGRYGRDLSLVLFDIDHFKETNDAHGHLGGDAVLSAVCHADRRARSARRTCWLASAATSSAVLLPEATSSTLAPRRETPRHRGRGGARLRRRCARHGVARVASLEPGTTPRGAGAAATSALRGETRAGTASGGDRRGRAGGGRAVCSVPGLWRP